MRSGQNRKKPKKKKKQDEQEEDSAWKEVGRYAKVSFNVIRSSKLRVDEKRENVLFGNS